MVKQALVGRERSQRERGAGYAVVERERERESLGICDVCKFSTSLKTCKSKRIGSGQVEGEKGEEKLQKEKHGVQLIKHTDL